MSKRVISSRVRRLSLVLGLALAALWSLGGTLTATTTAYAGPDVALSPASPAGGPLVIATIPVGKNPAAVGVNPTTNRIYVANRFSDTVSVIDGASNSVIATVAVGAFPSGIGVDPNTHRVYVSNFFSNTLLTIDGLSNTVVATTTMGAAPIGVGVNPNTSRVYVANQDRNNVSVIDTVSQTVVATVTTEGGPYGVSVNPNTNRIYVTNSTSNTVSVIDGVNNTTLMTVAVGGRPYSVGVNPNTDRVYVANSYSGTVSVIDAIGNTVVATVPVGSSPGGIGVNPTTNRIYVANAGSNTVSVIDGASNTVSATVSVGANPFGISVNPNTSRIYVANFNSDDVSVIEDKPYLDLAKSVTPTTNVPYHGLVTYTVILKNTNAVSGTSAVVTDTLPTGVIFGVWIDRPGSGVIQNGKAITWTGVVAASADITFTFTATHTGNYNDVIINTAYFSAATQTGSSDAAFTVTSPYYLLTIGHAGDGGGIVTTNPPGPTYTVGMVVILTATPAISSTFAGWSGDAVGLTNPITVTMLDNKAITATFALKTFIITPTTDAHGSLTPATPQTVNYGASQTFTITPNTGYHIIDVGVDGITQGPIDLYAFTNVIANHTISAAFGLDANTVTLTMNITGTGGGVVTLNPPGPTYIAGTVVTLTATPLISSTFIGWSGDVNGSAPSMTVTMDVNKTITATFAINTFVITPTAGAHGAITPSTPQTVNYGASQAFTITPNTGYHIANVAVDGISQGPIDLYTFTNVTANHTISAAFAVSDYTLTVSYAGNGTGSVLLNPPGPSYAAGTFITLTATPLISSTFIGWSGDVNGINSPITLTMDANKSVTATFALKTYIITPTTGANGSITPATPQTMNYGASQTFTITSDTGYHTVDVGIDGISQGPLGLYPFTNVTANHTISAAFAVSDYTLTVSYAGNGTGSVLLNPPGPSYAAGTLITLTATPLISSTFTGWSGDVNGTSNPITVTMDADKSITATFALKTFVITPTAGANGTITPSTPQTVNYGASRTFTITPNTGYHIADVGVDGVSQGPIGLYAFTNVTANHTISAAFAINTYVITPTAGANGNITPPTPQTVNYGASRNFTITPNSGYHIADVGIDGVSQGPIDLYAFTNITADHTISAAFAINTYIITPTTDVNGAITPSTPQTVNYSASQTFTITPNTGYHTADVGVDGISHGPIGLYAFTNVTANHTISAAFALNAPNTFTLTVNYAGNGLGSVTLNPLGPTYTPGTIVTLTATPLITSTFSSWSGDVVTTTNPVTVTMTGNKIITATFTLKQSHIFLPMVAR